ncbi:MAG: hypothetical protein OHK0039_44640 [Bacteroidia bacterium]
MQDAEVISQLDQIGDNRILMPVVTVMELFAGAQNKQELQRMQRQIRHYNVLHLDEAASRQATDMIYLFRLSHGLTIPDALIGAMAIVHGFELYTYNRKDFQYMPNLRLYTWT